MTIDEAKEILLTANLSPIEKEAVFVLLAELETTIENLPNEEWRDVEGYEGLYQVSNFGRVKSFSRIAPWIMKLQIDKYGYSRVCLQRKGKVKLWTVHRLVAETFIPNPENKPYINHINGVKTDNRVENLEWCTQKENVQHAIKTGLKRCGVDSVKAKLTEEQVVYIRENPSNLTCAELARKFNTHLSNVSLIQQGKTFKNTGGAIREARIKPSRVKDEVRNEIRRLYKHGSAEFGTIGLAKRFGLHQSTIWDIVHEGAD